MPKTLINDISIYYEIYGNGEPVFFVSGFSADHLPWVPIAEKLSTHYQVILFDNRGAGQTDVPKGPYTIELMADDIVGLCTRLKIKKAHFVGNSMGGYIVQMLCFKHPQLVKSLVISNSAMCTHTAFHYYVTAQLELMKANAPLPLLMKASCAWAFSYQFLSQPGKIEELVAWGMQNPYPFTITGYEAQYAALDTFDSSAWADQIKVPTLIVSADQDLILSPALSKALIKKIKHADYFCFKDCGHLPHLEHPEEYIHLLSEFFESIKKIAINPPRK